MKINSIYVCFQGNEMQSSSKLLFAEIVSLLLLIHIRNTRVINENARLFVMFVDYKQVFLKLVKSINEKFQIIFKNRYPDFDNL